MDHELSALQRPTRSHRRPLAPERGWTRIRTGSRLRTSTPAAWTRGSTNSLYGAQLLVSALLFHTHGNAPGGTVVLDERMLRTLVQIGLEHRIVVTEVAGGEHSSQSHHYQGRAFDIGTIDEVVSTALPGSRQAARVIILCRNGGATEPLIEEDHVHCAWS